MNLIKIKTIVKEYLSYSTQIATIIIAVTAYLGLSFIIEERNLMREQNKMLKSSLENQTMPRALFGSKNLTSERKFGIKVNKVENNKFELEMGTDVVNVGTGIMRVLGYIYFVDEKAQNFRKKLLDGNFDEIQIWQDGEKDWQRNSELLPSEHKSVKLIMNDLEQNKTYFVSVIYFYKDLHGKLYYTEYIFNLPLKDLKIEENQFKVEFNKEEMMQVVRYHMYSSNDEYIRLLTRLKPAPLYKFLLMDK